MLNRRLIKLKGGNRTISINYMSLHLSLTRIVKMMGALMFV